MSAGPARVTATQRGSSGLSWKQEGTSVDLAPPNIAIAPDDDVDAREAIAAFEYLVDILILLASRLGTSPLPTRLVLRVLEPFELSRALVDRHESTKRARVAAPVVCCPTKVGGTLFVCLGAVGHLNSGGLKSECERPVGAKIRPCGATRG